MALGYSLPTDHLACGLTAALLYENPEDQQAVELRERVTYLGAVKAVTEVTWFDQGSVRYRLMLDATRSGSKAGT